ncbi:MAG: hypothetical protein HRF47_17265 [Chloroflexota bacterium]|jgi:hypothetical protein
MFNLFWVKIKEPRSVALLHGGSQEILRFEVREFYGNSRAQNLIEVDFSIENQQMGFTAQINNDPPIGDSRWSPSTMMLRS